MISFSPLWDTLNRRNMSTYDLIYKNGISANTIHRIKHNYERSWIFEPVAHELVIHPVYILCLATMIDSFDLFRSIHQDWPDWITITLNIVACQGWRSHLLCPWQATIFRVGGSPIHERVAQFLVGVYMLSSTKRMRVIRREELCADAGLWSKVRPALPSAVLFRRFWHFSVLLPRVLMKIIRPDNASDFTKRISIPGVVDPLPVKAISELSETVLVCGIVAVVKLQTSIDQYNLPEHSRRL